MRIGQGPTWSNGRVTDVTDADRPPFWAAGEAAVLEQLATSPDGLTDAEAAARRDREGGAFHAQRPIAAWRLVLRQVENPIVLLLIGATILSMALGDVIDGTIILAITAGSATLGFVQEHGAVRAVEDLMAAVRVRADVRRGGREVEVALDDVVRGDVLVLRAGDVVAGDALLLTSDALLVDESALTGESFPVEKRPAGALPEPTPLAARTNSVWCGTHVVSGTGTALVAAVGAASELGRVGARVAQAHVPTAFEIGLRRFGYLLMRTAGILVVAIFVVNVILDRPVIESLLFSLALAVGLTPQLLPTIVTVTLAHGARQMAHRQVIVKRLDAIEDIGSIDVLCTDKTGTLTDGTVHLAAALDAGGAPSDAVLRLGWINATGQQGFANPIDAALAAAYTPDGSSPRVLGELPYDFTRRMLSVLVDDAGRRTLITKGAFDAVIARCRLDPPAADPLRARFQSLSAEGYRVLGIATRTDLPAAAIDVQPQDEAELDFAGFLCFADPPKAGAGAAITELRSLGVAIKLITGDNRFAAAHAATAVGLDPTELVTGDALAGLDDAGLDEVVRRAVVFAEIDPLHKESVVAALRRSGHIVGFLGDGINDAPSLRAADVGISVDTAVDVAKHSASVVLLDKDLGVLAEGIRQGRQVFANTLKYVQVTISANFGNMVSMAAAAAVLPFLPLLPRQILLLNFLSDIPGTTIAADRVDPEAVAAPHGWDTGGLRRFMVTFGLISSLFDILTFAVLRLGLDAGPGLFRTGWFIESTATELAVMLVLRTRRRAWRSRPGRALVASSLLVAAITVGLPFSVARHDLGLVRPSLGVLGALVAITVAYVAATEAAKRRALAVPSMAGTGGAPRAG